MARTQPTFGIFGRTYGSFAGKAEADASEYLFFLFWLFPKEWWT